MNCERSKTGCAGAHGKPPSRGPATPRPLDPSFPGLQRLRLLSVSPPILLPLAAQVLHRSCHPGRSAHPAQDPPGGLEQAATWLCGPLGLLSPPPGPCRHPSPTEALSLLTSVTHRVPAQGQLLGNPPVVSQPGSLALPPAGHARIATGSRAHCSPLKVGSHGAWRFHVVPDLSCVGLTGVLSGGHPALGYG